ncbi:lanthionine synthetase C family protein [Streptacidiphilus neutrinimicus]|uniref:lanthionine synthetase C family protein n=1 Tax=Streptacidiphilus neutrinimicus TaxID=105420 RepID=UPI0005A8FBDB|nr:lanthionine synthetase C family protein [Streptacidiphilus neutrinimicus]
MTRTAPLQVANTIADLLADPEDVSSNRQQLAYGPAGIALLHIERAAAGFSSWQRARDWLAAASGPVTIGPDSHPFYGVPALAHAVARAADHKPSAYQGTLARMDGQIQADVQRRLDAAHRRIDAGRLPQLAEFDAIRGLVGYGAYLLHRAPLSLTLTKVLHYCTRLTEPVTVNGEDLPGWWTDSGPAGRPDPRFPGGHGNTGMAHGISGVLALLALAKRHGYTVSGHHAALRRILAWLDRWREDDPSGATWPYWVTRAEPREGRPQPSAPRRPSWCYGTAGHARAQQLAALALRDTRRQIHAETTLTAALLPDSDQLKATTDHGLCHGFAGLAHIADRAAVDARPLTARQLRAAIPALLDAVCPPEADPAAVANALVHDETAGPGFLNGAAGVALALTEAASGTPPISSWDACLLIA